MTFNDSKGLLSKAKKLTEEEVSVLYSFLNYVKNSYAVPEVISTDAAYAYVKNDIETTNNMLAIETAKRMLNSVYGISNNERRNTMPTSCRTCSIVYQTNNPACRACMRKRDEEAQRNYYTRNNLKIKNVIFNPPATIVFWEDNTKTVVKAVNEVYDPEKGLAMAFMKKALGNQGNYFNTVKKWVEKYKPDEEMIYPNVPKLDTAVSAEDFYNFLNSAFEVKKATADGDNTK